MNSLSLSAERPVIAYWKVLRWNEQMWEDFCAERFRVAEGAEPDQGLVKTARQWNLTVVELQHLMLEAGVVQEDEARREALAKRMLSVSEMAVDMVTDKMQDEAETKGIKLRDAATVARMMSDASLNLKNGTAAPQMNISMNDIKAIITLAKGFEAPYEPIKAVEGSPDNPAVADPS